MKEQLGGRLAARPGRPATMSRAVGFHIAVPSGAGILPALICFNIQHLHKYIALCTGVKYLLKGGEKEREEECE